jgi:hypothetical protein
MIAAGGGVGHVADELMHDVPTTCVYTEPAQCGQRQYGGPLARIGLAQEVSAVIIAER